MTTKTKKKTIGDLLRFEVQPEYCREAVTVQFTNADTENAVTIELADPMGYPLKFVSGTTYELALAADANTVDALLLADYMPDLEVAAEGTEAYPGKYTVLVRGPADIRKSALPTEDVLGDAITTATLVTQLKTLSILCRDEPTVTSTQST